MFSDSASSCGVGSGSKVDWRICSRMGSLYLVATVLTVVTVLLLLWRPSRSRVSSQSSIETKFGGFARAMGEGASSGSKMSLLLWSDEYDGVSTGLRRPETFSFTFPSPKPLRELPSGVVDLPRIVSAEDLALREKLGFVGGAGLRWIFLRCCCGGGKRGNEFEDDMLSVFLWVSVDDAEEDAVEVLRFLIFKGVGGRRLSSSESSEEPYESSRRLDPLYNERKSKG